jgi:tellurite resistance protein TehA-like permease/glutaredoxin
MFEVSPRKGKPISSQSSAPAFGGFGKIKIESENSDIQRTAQYNHECSHSLTVDEGALVSDETEALKASNLSTFLDNRKVGVVMLSKSTCPFCFELKRTLQSFGVHYIVIEADKTGKMNEICKEMHASYGMSTFPLLLIDGTNVGGCTDCKTLQFSGDFQAKLSAYMTRQVPPETRHPYFSILYFPETVNNWAVRCTGLLTTLYAIFCTAFWDHRATKWAVLALAIDFTLRIVFGGPASPIGMLGAALVARIPPVLVAGPPKQFAACCGWFMSAMSAALYLSGEPIGGVVMIGALIGPAAMECLLDFCLGCWMFGYAIDFGLIPASIYRPYLNSFASKAWAWNYIHDDIVRYPNVTSEHVMLPGQSKPTPVDLIRKDRFETEYKNQDISVRHVTVDFYTAPLAVAALSLVFKLLADGSHTPATENRVGHWGTRPVFQALGITSVALCSLISLAYLVKAFLWPKKIKKEWNHPIYGNFFSAIAMCITLYGILLFNKGPTWAISLVWIGSAAQMVMTVRRISDLIYNRIGPDMITPALMMAPVGNFISAIGFGTYEDVKGAVTLSGDINYLFVGRLWFSVAVVFGIVLFTVTFQKAILDHHSDPRMRPTLFIWMAACAVAGPAYLAISYEKDVVVRDVFYQTLWLFAVFLCAVNGVGYLRGFHSYVQDTSIWMPAFSFCALSINTIQYYFSVDDKFTQILAIISVVLACTTVAVSGCYTFMWLLDLSLLKPRNKWVRSLLSPLPFSHCL